MDSAIYGRLHRQWEKKHDNRDDDEAPLRQQFFAHSAEVDGACLIAPEHQGNSYYAAEFPGYLLMANYGKVFTGALHQHGRAIMAKRWKRCDAGNCTFKDGAGTSLTLPEPREAREKKCNVKPTDNLVYDAISDPLKAACRGNECACFIIVQHEDKHGNIEVESPYTGDGDATPYEAHGETIGPLTKTDVDGYSKKQEQRPETTFNFTFACLKVENKNGKKIPIPVK